MIKEKIKQSRLATLKEIICSRCGTSYEKWEKKGILCNLEVSNGAHSFQIKPEIPSGVSGWEAYGKKFGYWDYFKKKEN